MLQAKKPKLKRFSLYESVVFGGKIVQDPETKKNRMKLNAMALFNIFIERTCKLGDDVSLYITNKKPTRTERQNRYLHVYLSLICLSMEGNTIQDLKDWIHQYHLVEKVSVIHGVEVKTCKSTAKLKVSEFCDMLAWIEKETSIPLPDCEPFLKCLTHAEYDLLKENEKRIYMKLTPSPYWKEVKIK